jgi:hypothetical protein
MDIPGEDVILRKKVSTYAGFRVQGSRFGV